MERLRNVSLIPIVSLTMLLTVLTTVLVFIGFPWAGVGSAIMCAAAATALTLGLAFIFTHGPESHHS
jgi:hypothetical protein